jgi:peroxiredoxin
MNTWGIFGRRGYGFAAARASCGAAVSVLALSLLACSREPAHTTEREPATKAQSAAMAGPSPAAPAAVAKVPGAELGSPAPEFTLPDLDGHPVSLSAFKGKTVVLEWFNPDCPFVKLSHTKGSLVGLAEKHTKAGVVWLAINSGAPGKQGHGAETNRAGVKAYAMQHPVLVDEDGKVGRAYGAARTPHLFVINPSGELVYKGAIDNSPDGERASAPGGNVINYLEQALEDVALGKPVRTPQTEAYGCSVKY